MFLLLLLLTPGVLYRLVPARPEMKTLKRGFVLALTLIAPLSSQLPLHRLGGHLTISRRTSCNVGRQLSGSTSEHFGIFAPRTAQRVEASFGNDSTVYLVNLAEGWPSPKNPYLNFF